MLHTFIGTEIYSEIFTNIIQYSIQQIDHNKSCIDTRFTNKFGNNKRNNQRTKSNNDFDKHCISKKRISILNIFTEFPKCQIYKSKIHSQNKEACKRNRKITNTITLYSQITSNPQSNQESTDFTHYFRDKKPETIFYDSLSNTGILKQTLWYSFTYHTIKQE